jgi:hypothetical protein
MQDAKKKQVVSSTIHVAHNALESTDIGKCLLAWFSIYSLEVFEFIGVIQLGATGILVVSEMKTVNAKLNQGASNPTGP